jgi:hypothetical protein
MLLDHNAQAGTGGAQRVLCPETSQQPTGIFGCGGVVRQYCSYRISKSPGVNKR